MVKQQSAFKSPCCRLCQEFRRADGEHRARLTEYEQVHNDREDRRRDETDRRWRAYEMFLFVGVFLFA